jgi:hypothetical protein
LFGHWRSLYGLGATYFNRDYSNYKESEEMKARLIKMAGGSALRTSIVEGECKKIPIRGESFILIATPLEGGLFRIVQTSFVVKIERPESDEEEYVITTRSGSKYCIEILE